MRIAVPKEVVASERRVALVPDAVRRLVGGEVEVCVQAGAGAGAGFADAAYEEAGARIAADAASLYADAAVVVKVRGPVESEALGRHEAELPRAGALLIGLLSPLAEPDAMRKLAEHGVTALALELVPRISRAQSMDALSSQSTVAGYRAAILAAHHLGKFFPMLVTAAGTVRPARVLVLGAGVAGLQAIATARRLGAIVEAFDIRPAVKEQVESLGATFVELELEEEAEEEGGYAKEVSDETQRREQELIAQRVAAADVVITTAQVPGKAAPVLVTEAMVDAMRGGSVIVDLAAESGGNCEPTEAGREVDHDGVLILGPVNLPATLPVHASQMYARNVITLLEYVMDDGRAVIDLDDEIVGACCVTHGGRIVNDRVREAVGVGA